MGLTVVPGNMIEDGTVTDSNFDNTTITSADMALDPRNASNMSSGDVPLAQLDNVDLTGLEDDTALLGFKAAANGSLVKYNLLDQTVDAFEDTSGVDASASTNEIRDSAGKYYSGILPGNYFGNGELGTCQFGASSITQTGDTVAIDGVLSTGSESGGPGSSSYGHGVPNDSACYEATVLNTNGSYDGDMVIMQFDTLTIDASVTLTTKQPCRGMFIYVKNNCTINGALSMTSRGGLSDPTVSGGSDSSAVNAGGLQLGLLTSGGSSSFTNDGSGFAGSGTAVKTAIANQNNTASNGTTFTVSKLGGASIPRSGPSSGGAVNGTTGNAGTTGGATISTGSGGSGGVNRGDPNSTGWGGASGAGGAFSAGAGGGGTGFAAGQGDNVGGDYGGAGGIAVGFNSGSGSSNGAGNPGGQNTSYSGAVGQNGVGGLIWLLVGGDLTLGGSSKISAKGSEGGGGGQASGGSAGGGAVFALYAGTQTGSNTIDAAGGASNTQGAGDGGAGGTGGSYLAAISEGSQYNNMTLVSNLTAAQAAPTKGDIVFTYSDAAGTAVINTNITAEISADNGSTWTTFSGLTSQGTTGGHTIVSAHDQTISSTITAPYNMKYRIKTLVQSAAMDTRIQAVSLGWS